MSNEVFTTHKQPTTTDRPDSVNRESQQKAEDLGRAIDSNPIRRGAMDTAVALVSREGHTSPLSSLLVRIANGPDIPGGLTPAEANEVFPGYRREINKRVDPFSDLW